MEIVHFRLWLLWYGMSFHQIFSQLAAMSLLTPLLKLICFVLIILLVHSSLILMYFIVMIFLFDICTV